MLRPSTDYAGLLDAIFHMMREVGAGQPPATIRMLEVLGRAGSVERDPARRRELRRHIVLAAEAALRATPDAAAQVGIAGRRARALAALADPG